MPIEQSILYSGKVKLVFDSGRHQYHVNGKRVWGVTSIIGILDKPALMYWAVNQAMEYLQRELKPGIALDEVEIKSILAEAKRAHTVKKNKATDIGTMTHGWIEKYIKAATKREKLPKRPVNKEMNNAIDCFFNWMKKNKAKFISSERKIYSKKYKYAGMVDLDVKINGKRTVVDIKTSNGIYPEYFLQGVAYMIALEEELKVKYDGGITILQLPKEGSKLIPFNAQNINGKEIAAYKKAFLGCLPIYNWKIDLKK